MAACEACQRRNGSPIKAPSTKAPDISVPLEKVSANLIELGISQAGFKYCLTIVDYLLYPDYSSQDKGCKVGG